MLLAAWWYNRSQGIRATIESHFPNAWRIGGETFVDPFYTGITTALRKPHSEMPQMLGEAVGKISIGKAKGVASILRSAAQWWGDTKPMRSLRSSEPYSYAKKKTQKGLQWLQKTTPGKWVRRKAQSAKKGAAETQKAWNDWVNWQKFKKSGADPNGWWFEDVKPYEIVAGLRKPAARHELVAGTEDEAATKMQALWRGYRERARTNEGDEE
jgi:hypothetical protein